MCRIDEELYLFFGNVLALFHPNVSDDICTNQYDGYYIYKVCPNRLIEWRFDDDLQISFFYDVAVVQENGSNLKIILSRTDIGVFNKVRITRLGPFVIESFQFPGIEDA